MEISRLHILCCDSEVPRALSPAAPHPERDRLTPLTGKEAKKCSSLCGWERRGNQWALVLSTSNASQGLYKSRQREGRLEGAASPHFAFCPKTHLMNQERRPQHCTARLLGADRGRASSSFLIYSLIFLEARASPMAQTVKNLPASQENWGQSLCWEDPPETGMATHSSILAWRIPWTEEPGGLQSVGLQRVGHDWATKHKHTDVLTDHLVRNKEIGQIIGHSTTSVLEELHDQQRKKELSLNSFSPLSNFSNLIFMLYIILIINIITASTISHYVLTIYLTAENVVSGIFWTTVMFEISHYMLFTSHKLFYPFHSLWGDCHDCSHFTAK